MGTGTPPNVPHQLQLTGNGDCFEPHDGVMGIGSGGAFAAAAARALLEADIDISAKEIALRAWGGRAFEYLSLQAKRGMSWFLG